MYTELADMFETLALPEKKHQVAVWMACYNAEEWVAQAIESVVTQEGVDPVIILFDDCSTDSTREILESLIKRYPSFIYMSRPVRNTFAAGTQSIRMDLLEKVNCEYIAILDADDFWNTPYKLRLSVSAICGSEVVASAHKVNILGKSQRAQDYRALHENVPVRIARSKFYRDPGYLPWRAATCSLVIRREAFPFFLRREISSALAGDLVIKIGVLSQGEIAFVDSALGTYRVHAQSLWSSRTPAARYVSTLWTLLLLGRRLGRFRMIRFALKGAGWACLSFYLSLPLRTNLGAKSRGSE
jgi:glycosyltransferase involved in cell wall biosynthesis